MMEDGDRVDWQDVDTCGPFELASQAEEEIAVQALIGPRVGGMWTS